jgi:hypothetical protein
MHPGPRTCCTLHHVMERRSCRPTHWPAASRVPFGPIQARARARSAVEHSGDLVVGVVAVAGLGIELPGRAEAPPARVPLVPVLALLRGRAAAAVAASGALLARACARALLAGVPVAGTLRRWWRRRWRRWWRRRRVPVAQPSSHVSLVDAVQAGSWLESSRRGQAERVYSTTSNLKAAV